MPVAEWRKTACNLCYVNCGLEVLVDEGRIAKVRGDREYGGKAIVPIQDVCRDYFSHLNPTKLIQKISAGDIAIPLVRMESSQKCAKGVHLLDLAKYLDARVDAARKEMAALTT